MSVGRALAAAVLVVAPAAPAEASLHPHTVADCETQIAAAPDDLESYRCFWIVARRTGDWQEAVAAIEARLVDEPDDPRLLLYLGAIFADLGDPRVVDRYQGAAAGFRASGEAAGECLAHIGLTDWLGGQLETEAARFHLEHARRAADQSGDSILNARVVLATGWQAVRERDLAVARSSFLSAEKVVFPDGPYDLRFAVLNGLGYVGWATGRYRSALELYRRAIELAAGEGDAYSELNVRYNALLMEERLQTAVERQTYEDTLALAVREGNLSIECRLRLMLGQEYSGERARAELSRALEISREIHEIDSTLLAMRLLGWHEIENGEDPSAGLEILRESIELARGRQANEDLALCQIALASALWDLGQHEEGLAAWLEALDLFESLRDTQGDEETGSRVAARFAFAYQQITGQLFSRAATSWSTSDVELALTVGERLRAHALAEAMHSAGVMTEDLGSPTVPLVDLAELHNLLHHSEALLWFQVAAGTDADGTEHGGSWVVAMTRSAVHVQPLPGNRELESAVDMFLGLVREMGPHGEYAAHRIYDMVLRSTMDLLPPEIDRLIIVPDGALHALPFAMLRPSQKDPYLVERCAVSVAPSLTAFKQWREQPAEQRPAAVLAFADPLLPAAEGRVALLRGVGLGALPHARHEARAACRRLGGVSHALIGVEASETSAKSMPLGGFPIVHFATHSVVDSAEPERSAILLAATAETDDGLLTIAEISELELDGALLVLSSCSSAAGVILQGEGVLGLTRAFYRAGARSVIGNLWQVKDEDAAWCLGRFYEHLAEGVTAADALALSQRDAIDSGLEPASWAAMVLHGDNLYRVIPPPPSMQTSVAVGVGVAVVFIIAMALWRRQSRRSTS